MVYPRVREEGVGGGVIALCSDCRVLSAASAGKEVGRLAALRVLASAPLLMGGGLPGGKGGGWGGTFGRASWSPVLLVVGGVCQLVDFPTCQLTDFSTCWEVGGAGRRR